MPEASHWLKQQADANGWQDLVLIGHSYGGGAALIVANGASAGSAVEIDNIEAALRLLEDAARRYADVARSVGAGRGQAVRVLESHALDRTATTAGARGGATPSMRSARCSSCTP